MSMIAGMATSFAKDEAHKFAPQIATITAGEKALIAFFAKFDNPQFIANLVALNPAITADDCKLAKEDAVTMYAAVGFIVEHVK